MSKKYNPLLPKKWIAIKKIDKCRILTKEDLNNWNEVFHKKKKKKRQKQLTFSADYSYEETLVLA
jgi:hypothetical protein